MIKTMTMTMIYSSAKVGGVGPDCRTTDYETAQREQSRLQQNGTP